MKNSRTGWTVALVVIIILSSVGLVIQIISDVGDFMGLAEGGHILQAMVIGFVILFMVAAFAFILVILWGILYLQHRSKRF